MEGKNQIEVYDEEEFGFLIDLCDKSGEIKRMLKFLRIYLLQKISSTSKIAKSKELKDTTKNDTKNPPNNTSHLSFSENEKNLISRCYNRILEDLRKSKKKLVLFEESVAEDEKKKELVEQYMKKIDKEIFFYCKESLHLIDTYIVKSCRTEESLCYFFKLKGDFNRYLVEITQEGSDLRKKYVDKSMENYNIGKELAEKHLKPTNIIRLSIYMNLGILYCNNLQQNDVGRSLVKSAFIEASNEIKKISGDEQYLTKQLLLKMRKIFL